MKRKKEAEIFTLTVLYLSFFFHTCIHVDRQKTKEIYVMKQERRQIHRLLIRKEKKRKDMMTQYPYNKPRDEKKERKLTLQQN